jgi:hypothetical protein
MENLISSWWKRFLVAGFLIIFMLMLPEDMPFRVDVLRGALMGLAVSIVIYPAFSKAVQHTFLPKGIRYALAWCALCPLLWATIAAVDLFYLQEITLAVAFFVIVLFLSVLWLLFEVSLLQSKQPEWQPGLINRQKPSSEPSPIMDTERN